MGNICELEIWNSSLQKSVDRSVKEKKEEEEKLMQSP